MNISIDCSYCSGTISEYGNVCCDNCQNELKEEIAELKLELRNRADEIDDLLERIEALQTEGPEIGERE